MTKFHGGITPLSHYITFKTNKLAFVYEYGTTCIQGMIRIH